MKLKDAIAQTQVELRAVMRYEEAEAAHRHDKILWEAAMKRAEDAESKLAKIAEQTVSDRWNCKRENAVGRIVHDMLDEYEAILGDKP